MSMNTSYEPLGLSVPIRRGNSGYFEQTIDTNSRIKENLLNFIKTKKGEIRMKPEFGTSLYSLLFDQLDENIKEIVSSTLIREINYWIPEISIENITVDTVKNPIGDDNYKLRININFVVIQTRYEDEIIFDLESPNI